jgi:hypothetical protein
MKLVNLSDTILVFALSLSSCVPAAVTNIPVQTEKLTALPTFTATPAPTLAITPTLTPPTTLEPHQVEESIEAFFQKPTNCPAPCFWGIVPGQTTIGEATNIFIQLGLQIKHTNFDGKDLYGVGYFFGNGFSSIILTVEDGSVTNLETSFLPDKQKVGAPRDWLAYSPETLINQYGTPSKVDFFVGRAAPTPLHSIVMYFYTVNLIVEYSGADIIADMVTLQVCPLVNQVDSVRIWIGRNTQSAPPVGVPLEKATSLTLDEYAELMTSGSENACFNLEGQVFP